MNTQHEIINRQMLIRPITPDDLPKLEAAAQADNHGVFLPSHLITRDAEIVGYLSIGQAPTIFTWLHTKKMNVRDTVGVLNFYENFVACNGHRIVTVPCMADSPLHPYMAKFGYTAVCPTTLFVKKLI